MTPKAGYRGQPLFMLAVLLGGWAAVRTVLWDPAFPPGHEPRPMASVARSMHEAARPVAPASNQAAAAPHESALITDHPAAPLEAFLLSDGHRASRADSYASFASAKAPPPGTDAPFQTAPGPELPVRGAGAAEPAGRAAPAAAPFPVAPRRSSTGRWSGDAWLLLREDTSTAITSGRGSYGQSQAGAVLRYRLAPMSVHRPSAFARASQALAGAEETEVAAGLSARPVPAIPIVAAAELRVTRVSGQVMWRPAAYAYTELPVLTLPLSVRAEAYMQAGYVGGDFATAFVDGQLRAERAVARVGSASLSAGGGIWGGAQKGAERLDIGPGATAKIPIGGVPARMSLDWRFRVAGDAEPSNGPALTLSAGF